MPASNVALALVALVYPRLNSGENIAQAGDEHEYGSVAPAEASFRGGSQYQMVGTIRTMDLPACISTVLWINQPPT